MNAFRKYLLAAVAMSGMCLFAVTTTRASEDHTMTGVLIDNACGAKQADEAAATKHPLKCDMKDACAASGYQLIVGDKHYKLDDKGNEQAKAYFAHADSSHVTVAGTMKGDTMEVTSIKAAPKDAK